MISNKKAYFDYEILEEYTCGMVLESWEVKSIAGKTCSIAGSYCRVARQEIYLVGASMGSADFDQQRSRKLLLTKDEIKRLVGKTQEQRLTLVPLKIFQIRGKFKIVIGLARGKNKQDRRDTERKRDIENENRRIVKSQQLS